MQLNGEGPLTRKRRRPVNESRFRAQAGHSELRSEPRLHADCGSVRHVQVLRHAISVGSGFDQTECMARTRNRPGGTKLDLFGRNSWKWANSIDRNVGTQHQRTTFRANRGGMCRDDSKLVIHTVAAKPSFGRISGNHLGGNRLGWTTRWVRDPGTAFDGQIE